MSRGLVNEKKAKEFRKIDKFIAVSKVVIHRITDILKVVLIVAIIVAINTISIKLTNILQSLDFTQMRVGIFTIISFFILFEYLKSSEEIKKGVM